MSKVDGDLIQSILWYAIAAIWALIEFVLILAHSGSYAYDAQGQPLQ